MGPTMKIYQFCSRWSMPWRRSRDLIPVLERRAGRDSRWLQAGECVSTLLGSASFRFGLAQKIALVGSIGIAPGRLLVLA
jgi:hypothetical protein